jgi:transcriptional regulator with XRE-family HTH domain
MPKSLNTPRHELVKAALIAQRKAKRMTQADVAEKLGKHQSYIAKIEGGERRIDVVELVDVAEIIDLDVGSLLKAMRKVRR